MATRPAATSPNTGTFTYLDKNIAKKTCEKEKKAIEKHCGPEDETEKTRRQQQSRGGAGSLLSKLKLPAKKDKVRKGNANWINDHCEFLMVKPSDPNGLLKQLQDLPENMAEQLGKSALEKVISEAKQKIEHEIEEKVVKIMAKKGAQKVAGRALSLLTGPFAIVINVAMTAYDVYDAAKTYQDVAAEFESKFKEIKNTADKLADVERQINEVRDQLTHSRYQNADGSFSPQKMVSDVMYAAAELNPCIRARRCSLVPFEQVERLDGKGCCPGQTGHHLLPSAMFDGCAAYDEKKAPVLCVEGHSNWAGSHHVVHERLKQRLGQLTDRQGDSIPPGTAITKKEAIDAGAKSLADAFPLSKCDKSCIEAQLNKHYGNLNCTPKNKSGASGGDAETAGGNTN